MWKNLSCSRGIEPRTTGFSHQCWSVEYETAASGTTQQYKGKMWRSWKSWVVIAQWLEHWWLKPVVLGSIPQKQLRFFSHFSFAFFPDPFKWESFNVVFMKGQNLVIVICMYIYIYSTLWLILTSNTEAAENKVEFLNYIYAVKGFQQ